MKRARSTRRKSVRLVPSKRSRLSRKLQQPKIVISESKIVGAGMGAFANRNFRGGEFLDQYWGIPCELGSDGDYVLEAEQTRFDKHGNPYVVALCIDAEDPSESNWTRQINSVRPGDGLIQNVTFKFTIDSEGNDQIGVYALRDIKKGQELYWNYGNEYF